MAAKARSITCGFRSRDSGVKVAILAPWRSGTACRPAVDTGGRDPHEKPPVETAIARPHRTITGIVIEKHRHAGYNPEQSTM